ncbi:MAG: enoyl-CoA hydratase-related protein [Fidelibacterota bacterium]
MNKIIRFTYHDDGIGFLTLGNSPVNALSHSMIDSLNSTLMEIEKLSDVHVLVVTSSEKHFCVGLDLKERVNMDKEQVVKNVDRIQSTFTRLADLPIPTICGISGAALGGGAELALACDFRILSRDAIIGFPETGLGIIPGAGGTQRLPRLIGPSKAKYWIFSGQKFNAEEALEDGVADFLVDDGTVLESAIELAGEILMSGPIAVRAAKSGIQRGLDTSLEEGLKLERDLFKSLIKTDDSDEGLNAFIEKRSPEWKNR